jgi:hypothetical protein
MLSKREWADIIIKNKTKNRNGICIKHAILSCVRSCPYFGVTCYFATDNNESFDEIFNKILKEARKIKNIENWKKIK